MQLLLERILTPQKSDEWQLGPDVRHAAANALRQYAERRGGTGALYSAIAAYRRILAEDWRRERNPMNWASAQNGLAIALQRLGEREGSPTRWRKRLRPIARRWRLTMMWTRRHMRMRRRSETTSLSRLEFSAILRVIPHA